VSSLLADRGDEGEGRRLCFFFFGMETGSSWFKILALLAWESLLPSSFLAAVVVVRR
jgi:hypothetical protein